MNEKEVGVLKHPTLKKVKNAALDAVCLIGGSVLYSIALLSFAAPNHIAPGGASGIATVVNYLWGLPIGAVVLVVNVPLLILGWKFLGSKFIVKTAVGTVVMSVAIDVLSPLLPVYKGDRLLAALYGGALAGAGLVLFFLRGATSGGTDILVRLLQKRYPFLSMGRVVLMVDLVVILIAAAVYRSIDSALYAVVYIFVSSKVIDEVLYGTGNGKLVTIVTRKGPEIAAAILEKMSRGVSVLPVEGGYTGEKKSMLYCALRKTEFVKLKKIVKTYDPEAFVVIMEANEIIGQGFNTD